MNFIASTLIASLGNDEELAFWIFMHLLITRDMKALYLPGVPELHLKNF